MLLQWINKYSNVSLIYIKEICNVTPDGNNVSPLLQVLLYLLTLMYGHCQHNLTLRQDMLAEQYKALLSLLNYGGCRCNPTM